MPDFRLYAGETSQTVYIRLRDSTTGLGKTGLVFNSAGFTCSYTLPGAARAAITLVTLTSASAAWSSGGFILVDDTNCKGLYRLDLPNAAIASGKFTIISIEFDGIIEESMVIPLEVPDANTIQWLGTAAATPTVAGVPEVDITHQGGGAIPAPAVTGVPDVNLTHHVDVAASVTNSELDVNVGQIIGTAPSLTTGDIDVNIATIAASAITAASIATDAIGAAELATDAVNEIRDSIISDATTFQGADIANILTDTGTTIPASLPAALTKGTADSGSTTTMVDAILNEADTDYWKGSWIRFTSGTITGQTRLITAFTPGTDTVTFAPATTQAVGTDTYEIIPAGGVDVELWLGSVVNALVAGAVDADVSAIQSAAITAASIATDAIGSAELATTAVTEIRDAITGGAYALDTDANGAIRIVDGTGARELNTNAGAVAVVDLVTTLTTYTGNTLQTGDSFARLGAPAGASIAADLLVIDNFVDGLETTIGVAGVGLNDLGGMSTAMQGEVNTEVDTALRTTTVTLPGQVAPPLTPTIEEAVGWMYKVLRNRTTQTATLWALYADDESTVDAKATVSDAAGTATVQEIVVGPV